MFGASASEDFNAKVGQNRLVSCSNEPRHNWAYARRIFIISMLAQAHMMDVSCRAAPKSMAQSCEVIRCGSG